MSTLFFYQIIGAVILGNLLCSLWVYAVWRGRREGLDAIPWKLRLWLLVPCAIVFISGYSLGG